jgi:transcriptional regulator with XRE-family HTH domain
MELVKLKERLKKIRIAKGLSQQDIAKKIKKPQSVISRLETQTRYHRSIV